MIQSITCVIFAIETWMTGMSNPVVSFVVGEGVITHEVCNKGNGNDHWRFCISWEKYSMLASRLVIIVNMKIA